MKINSETAGSDSFVMPDTELKITPEIYRLGDTNGDGKINVEDVSSLLKYLAGYASYYYYLIAGSPCGDSYLDFNRDGRVNVSDAAEMLKYIAKYKGVGTAPEFETGFNVAFSDKSISLFEFATKSQCIPDYLDYNYDCHILQSPGNLSSFLYDTTSIFDDFYDVDDAGQLTLSQINPKTLIESYNEEFFEEYDLIAKVLRTDCNISTDIYLEGNKLIIDIDAVEPSEEISNKYWYILVAVPKGSVDSAVMTSDSETGMEIIRENQYDTPV